MPPRALLLALLMLLAGCTRAPPPEAETPAPPPPCGELTLSATNGAGWTPAEPLALHLRFVNCGRVPIDLEERLCMQKLWGIQIEGLFSGILGEDGSAALMGASCGPMMIESPILQIAPGGAIDALRVWNGSYRGPCILTLLPPAPPCPWVAQAPAGEYDITGFVRARGGWEWNATTRVEMLPHEEARANWTEHRPRWAEGPSRHGWTVGGTAFDAPEGTAVATDGYSFLYAAREEWSAAEAVQWGCDGPLPRDEGRWVLVSARECLYARHPSVACEPAASGVCASATGARVDLRTLDVDFSSGDDPGAGQTTLRVTLTDGNRSETHRVTLQGRLSPAATDAFVTPLTRALLVVEDPARGLEARAEVDFAAGRRVHVVAADGVLRIQT